MKYLQAGIFKVLIAQYENSDITSIDPNNFKEIARTLEFCSTNTDGINLLFQYKNTVFKILS